MHFNCSVAERRLSTTERVTETQHRARDVVPFLKWAGGKTQLLPHLLTHVPAHYRRYLEPFLGGGALFFALSPDVSLLNDLNEELILTYTAVQNNVEELIELVSSYPHSKEFYYKLRSVSPSNLNMIARAARFIYLNRTCYNGLYRVNKRNQFNVPFGNYKNPTICDEVKLRDASEALHGARLFSEDYKDFLSREARAGDFIYVDPPYQPASKYSDFKRYTSSFFYEKDQRELADLVHWLVAKDCYVLVSSSFTPLTKRLYDRYEAHIVQARRNINKDGKGRGRIREMLIVCRKP